jgi:hypothetical protein
LKSRGVLILYSESKQIDYLRLSNLCARLADHYLGVPTTIIKIEPEQKGMRTFKYTGLDHVKTEWNNIGRFNAYDLSPYDETILIDADYFVQTDHLANYFGSTHDFLCHTHSWDVTGLDQLSFDEHMSANRFKMRWATVCYFKKSTYAENIFRMWKSVHENYEYYSKLIGFSKEPYRNDFCVSIAHQVCAGYSNIDTFKHNLPAITTLNSVIDYGNKNWLILYEERNKFNVLRYSGDLHCMNKRCILETDVYDKLWNSV